MSNNTKNIEKPNLSERDMELLACAMRCAEGGFPKASLNVPLLVQFSSLHSPSASSHPPYHFASLGAGAVKPSLLQIALN